MSMMMPSADTIVALENGELSPLEAAVAMQIMINSGQVWRLQGSYGRSAMDAIKAGDCMLGEEEREDYWGNPVPPRAHIKQGTPGSREHVVARHGEEWAEALDNAGRI